MWSTPRIHSFGGMDATAGRWFVDVSAWVQDSRQWQTALQTLPEHEQLQVTCFMFAKDRHLALASRLLQRHVIRELFALAPDESVAIERTPEVRVSRSALDVPIAFFFP